MPNVNDSPMSLSIDAAGARAMKNRQQRLDDDDEEEKKRKSGWFSKIKQLLGYSTPDDTGAEA